MLEFSPLTVMLVGEVLAALVAALAALSWLGMRRRRRDRLAAMRLAALVRDRDPQRAADLRTLLEKSYQYQGERLDQTLAQLIRTEKLLYQKILNVYIKRDAANLEVLNEPVDALVGGYWKLDLPQGAGSESAKNPPGMDDLIDKLLTENEALKVELKITSETLTRMLSDYSNMFDKPDGEADQVDLGEPPQPAPAPAADEEIQELDMPLGGADQDDLMADMGDLWGGVSPVAEPDRTQVLSPAAGGNIDLAEPDDLDDLFASTAAPSATLGAGENENLDDIWAQALAEQEKTAHKG